MVLQTPRVLFSVIPAHPTPIPPVIRNWTRTAYRILDHRRPTEFTAVFEVEAEFDNLIELFLPS
jgi:hypothetical protein